MIDNLFRGLFDTDMTVIITPAEFLTCLGVSLGIGLILAALYQYHTRYTRSLWSLWPCCLLWSAWSL